MQPCKFTRLTCKENIVLNSQISIHGPTETHNSNRKGPTEKPKHKILVSKETNPS